MATEHVHNELRIVSLTRGEAADLVGLLVAQLAGVPLTGNTAGSVASTNVVEKGVLKYRLILTLEDQRER